MAPSGLEPATLEDFDAAPSGTVPLPDGVTGNISTVLINESTQTMWTGHKDRHVCRWTISNKSPGMEPAIPRFEQKWMATGFGAVSAIACLPWGDLWTGSEAGSIRVWVYQTYGGSSLGAGGYSSGSGSSTSPPIRIRELRRPQGKKCYEKVLFIVPSSSGGTVWTVGKWGNRHMVLVRQILNVNSHMVLVHRI